MSDKPLSTTASQVAVYAGTFDPITLGHRDIALRAAKIFKTVIIAVAKSSPKTPMLSVEERMELIRGAVSSESGNFLVESFDGLLVDYVRKTGAHVIIRGLRAVSDYEYEAQMALMNRQLAGDIETVFLMTSDKYSVINSSIVRQVAMHHGDVTPFVTKNVAEKLKKLFAKP